MLGSFLVLHLSLGLTKATLGGDANMPGNLIKLNISANFFKNFKDII